MSVTDVTGMRPQEVLASIGRGSVAHVEQPSGAHVYIQKPRGGKRFDAVWLNRYGTFYNRVSPDAHLVQAVVRKAERIEVGPQVEVWPEKQASTSPDGDDGYRRRR